MTETTDQLSEEDRRTFAGIHLMRYFVACIEAHAEDSEPISPEDMTPPDSRDELEMVVTMATAIVTGGSGDNHEERCVKIFKALADMLADRGAELEGLMQNIIHDEPRQALVIRIKTGTKP